MVYPHKWSLCHGHLSAAGRAQDSESSLAKDQRSTTVLCNQQYEYIISDAGGRCNLNEPNHSVMAVVNSQY